MRKLVGIAEQESRKNKPISQDIASKIILLFETGYVCKKIIRNILTENYRIASKVLCNIGHYLGHHGEQELLHKLCPHLSQKESMAMHASYHIARLGAHIKEAKSLKDPYQDLFNRYQARREYYCKSV